MGQPTYEQEARHYWSVMRQVSLLRRAKMACPDDLHDSIDELEVLATYTDHAILKRLALASAAILIPKAAMAEIFIGACL